MRAITSVQIGVRNYFIDMPCVKRSRFPVILLVLPPKRVGLQQDLRQCRTAEPLLLLLGALMRELTQLTFKYIEFTFKGV